VRAGGHEVWFQPQSRIIHYEGKTSGTDTRAGVKAYQVVNAKKFFLRWRDTLDRHRRNGESPYTERERGVNRRALVIDATNPTPKQDAGSVTTTLNLQLLRELGYKVHFMPQDNFLFQPVYTTDLQRMGIDCAYLPYEGGVEAYLRRYGWMFDVVLVFRVVVLEKTLDLLRTYAPQAPVLFNNMDLHFLRMEREAALAGDAEGLREAAAMRERELALINRVDCTMTPSTFEKQVLDEVAPDAKTLVLPFMMEFFGTSSGFSDRRDICFLGGYRHTPNVDAVRFFVTEVFPLIKAEEPDIRFIIAGAGPTEEVLALAREDVIVTGLVDDLADVFDTTRVFACSLRAGAGVKGKVAAAMAYGLPVVSTRVGAEGMDLVDGANVLLADEPADFAQACLRLYRDQRLWDRISANSQRLVQDFYSLDAGRRVLREAIEIGLRQKLQLDA
jgi:glycosyltransferase involved in cell wall biosynthesis